MGITPISFTSYCYFCECPLRFGFSKDQRFPQKINPGARMGSAFHAAINKVYQQDLKLNAIIDLFQNDLKIQRIESLKNYRERNLPWPRDLRETLENTLAAIFSNRANSKRTGVKSYFETTLVSKDRLIIGRPDMVIMTSEGPIIIDYKTGHFDQEYASIFEDQILFYSGLWQEIHGNYPILGRVEFLLDGNSVEISINKDKCISILAEVRKIANILKPLEEKLKAVIGDHCVTCDYRPWCNAYWSYDRKNNDLEGTICHDHPRDSKSFCLKNNKKHQIILNMSALPFPDWSFGTKVRILDPIVTGNIYSKGFYSELFSVVCSGG